MTTPIVSELSRHLEPVTRDTFIDVCATETVDPSAKEPVARAKALTAGRPDDYVLEAATPASARRQRS
jgi:hypothetical protein